jgi:hypothetical protein
MSRKLTLELPEDVYEGLREVAPRLGMTPEEAVVYWLRHYGPKAAPPPLSEQEQEAAWTRLLQHAGALRSHDANAADNNRIDADLAHEYSRGL